MENPLSFRPLDRPLKKRHLLLGVASLALIATVSSTRGERSAVAAVSGNSALEHIRFLASDELGGRGNGSEGLERAAHYIASQFEKLGLSPAGDNGTYFQAFFVTAGGTLGPDNTLKLAAGETEESLRLHQDFEPMTFSGAGEVAGAPIVFVGYGITAPEHGYDDYAGVDVGGKAVLLLRHIPREGRNDGPFDPQRGHATFVAKVVNAKGHGATAVLVITDPLNHRTDPDELVEFGQDLGADDLAIPALHIKQTVAQELFQKAGKDLLAVQEDIDEDLRPASFELQGSTVSLTVDVERKRGEVRNVLGYLAPESASGDEEILLIGAHYDHLGVGVNRHSQAPEGEDGIHNGADDNASGTAGVMELARVLSQEREGLKRGILFATFAGEELGLLGSRHYTAHPTYPLERTVAMLNLDMIGRLREGKLFIGGVGSSPVFQPKLEELVAGQDLLLDFSFSGYGSSDHASFVMAGVPSLFFFTGLHRDYHRPSDDWQEINVAGEEQVLRLAYQMADYLQSLPEPPQFVREERPRGEQGGAGGYGAYFGSVPDFGYQGKGVRFDDIREGSPAHQAGLKAGDILVYFNGREIDSLHDFTDALQRHKPGDNVPVIVIRDGASLEVRVELAQRP